MNSPLVRRLRSHLARRRAAIASNTLLALGSALGFAGSALAREDFYSIVDASKLTLADATEPLPTAMSELLGDDWMGYGAIAFGVALDGAGEAYLSVDPITHNAVLVMKTPKREGIAGRMRYLEAWNAAKQSRFTVSSDVLTAADSEQFEKAKREHYRKLANANVPGAAWFRHLAGPTDAATAGQNDAFRTDSTDDFERTFDMFGGTQAIAENLRLETVLRSDEKETASVDVSKIDGITTRPFDFEPLLAGKEPKLDALASFIPADQHAAFFASFPELVNVSDELKRLVTQPSIMIDERSVDALTLERLEHQLCLPVSDVARRFGALLVKQVAITGSDPFLRSGSDVAVLFETREKGTELLVEYWKANAKQRGPLQTGKAGNLDYNFVRTADRSTSTYLAQNGSVILITNSPVQLAAFDAVIRSERKPLANADDYRFFRTRYSSDEPESALIVIPDAALRRWVSPRFRIGDSRRVRALARLADERAGHVFDFAAGRAKEIVVPVDAVYGSLEYATPLAEIAVERCTQSEAAAYARFRNTYEQGFRGFFDPIAVRLRFTPERMEVDLSVIPIILDSDLNEFANIVKNARLTAESGHPHDLAIAQFTIAIDPENGTLRSFGDMVGARGSRGERLADPLSWLGGWFTAYIDDDPFLTEALGADDPDQFIDREIHRLPVAVEIGVKDVVRAGLFITSLRALADESVPGLLHFETKKHGEKSYVKIRGAEELTGEANLNLYYAIDSKRLIISLNEDVVKRSLDDSVATTQQKAGNELGDGVTAHFDRRAFEFMARGMNSDETQRRLLRVLPILEEWKRLFPNEDPVAFHERVFHERICGPMGEKLVVDPASGEIHSEKFGSPYHPTSNGFELEALKSLRSADFGLSFEHGGVRGRIAIQR